MLPFSLVICQKSPQLRAEVLRPLPKRTGIMPQGQKETPQVVFTWNFGAENIIPFVSRFEFENLSPCGTKARKEGVEKSHPISAT